MFAPTRYLDWARRFYGKVELDLASSGMTPVPARELGEVPALDEAGAWGELRARVAGSAMAANRSGDRLDVGPELLEQRPPQRARWQRATGDLRKRRGPRVEPADHRHLVQLGEHKHEGRARDADHGARDHDLDQREARPSVAGAAPEAGRDRGMLV